MHTDVKQAVVASTLMVFVSAAGVAAAQQRSRAAGHAYPVRSGPSTLPDTIARDDQGRATVRAVRVDTPIRIDGTLDEAIYGSVHPASGFIQMEPQAGEPAQREDRGLGLLRRGQRLRVSFRAWESQPERRVVNEMRRDSSNIRQGDYVGFSFDTFRDRRNAILFEANALGGRTDGQITNERQFNADWNPIWDVVAGTLRGRLDDGSGDARSSRSATRRARAGLGLPGAAHQQVEERDRLPDQRAAGARARARPTSRRRSMPTLVGLEAPPPVAQSRDQAVRDRRCDDRQRGRRAGASNDPSGDVGVDAKYGLTAEPDRRPHLQHRLRAGRSRRAAGQPHALQPVLSREARVLPREPGHCSRSAARRAGAAGADTPILFYSRRIGLDTGP